MNIDEGELRSWIGRTETRRDRVTPVPPAALAATLDRPAVDFEADDELPAPWHWLFFLPSARNSDLGADGHPQRGGFLPPVPLPRRMWAGSRMQFNRPLRIGAAVSRTSRIADVRLKAGRSGSLIFVKVDHRIADAAGDLLSEEQDIVYREAVTAQDAAPTPQAAPEGSHWRHEIRPDPVLLFRFSALTFNSHRIHYDQPYATQVENYPGLVVHGPLIATLLLESLYRERPGCRLRDFSFRALRPLFAGRPFRVCGSALGDGSAVRLWAQDEDGWLAMDAEARLA